ncbi:MAG: glycoside hydrolase family 99-like domain-containing protein [Marinilabiliales bacterium]|nr:glycoside hydrolase family 99-like domain-containing protein [Marinilabiliales bacterium]
MITRKMLRIPILLLLFIASEGHSQQRLQTSQNPCDVAAFYWPAYHPAARFRDIGVFPDGKGEWEAIYKSKPKFAGEELPRVPLWGYTDESDPKVMQQKIAAATSHGVNIFIFDWYWYDNKPFLEECLNDGFLKAPNCREMKFYLMWANHDHNSYLDPSNPDKSKIYWRGGVDSLTFERLTNHVIADYFRQPNYYRIDGMPVFSIYELGTFIKGMGGSQKAKAALDRFREKVRKAGFPGLHLQAIVWGQVPGSLEDVPSDRVKTQDEALHYLGFNSMTNYQWIHYVPIAPEEDYAEWARKGVAKWAAYDSTFTIPYFPQVSISWDNNPRFPVKTQHAVVRSTPERFRNALTEARKYLAKHPDRHRLVTINAWNEWAEGSYLEPDTTWKFGYLEAVREVFGE